MFFRMRRSDISSAFRTWSCRIRNEWSGPIASTRSLGRVVSSLQSTELVELVISKRVTDSTADTIYVRVANNELRKHRVTGGRSWPP